MQLLFRTAYKKRKRDTLCNDSGRKHQITFRQCLRSCLIDSAVGQIDCMFPWLQSADDDNDTSRMSYCNTYASESGHAWSAIGIIGRPFLVYWSFGRSSQLSQGRERWVDR